jgi:hypothetical protein
VIVSLPLTAANAARGKNVVPRGIAANPLTTARREGFKDLFRVVSLSLGIASSLLVVFA